MKNTPKNIDIMKLYPFEGHLFKVQDNEEMNALIESILRVSKSKVFFLRLLSDRKKTPQMNMKSYRDTDDTEPQPKQG